MSFLTKNYDIVCTTDVGMSIHSRTELRTDVSTDIGVTSNLAGVKIGGDRCRTCEAEWVRLGA